MEFASSHVYMYDSSDEECVSDDEYEQGMQRSDSDEDNDDTICARSTVIRGNDGQDTSTHGTQSTKTDSHEGEQGLFEKFKYRVRSLSAAEKSIAKDSGNLKGKTKKVSHWRANKTKYAEHSKANKGIPIPPTGGKKWRRADTNVVSVMFNKLTMPSNMHTGDPVFCRQCQAVLSHISKVKKERAGQIWKCEFCGKENKVNLSKEKQPTVSSTTLEPAAATTKLEPNDQPATDKSLVIFCMDISSSMSVTTEVPGQINLKWLQLFGSTQRNNVTWISRLQAMQAAVDYQLGEMQKNSPERRVALVTFGSQVTVVGVGFESSVHIDRNSLNNKDKMINLGKKMALPQPIKDTRKKLGKKVFGLRTGGSTALGPALLLSISMASQFAGSKVIVCTDGMANVGLGRLPCLSYDEFDFYSELSSFAVRSGVCVSVISMEETDCRMVELGRVADATNGQVNIVDPLGLTQEFGTILANPVIATNVTATMLLHKQLYFRHEERVARNRVFRYVGNVTKNSEITFEFGVKKCGNVSPTLQEVELDEVGSSRESEGEVAAAIAALHECSDDRQNLTQLPFQLQIVYRDAFAHGSKAMRVLTQSKPVTDERSVAEQNINVAVLGSHTAQLSAKLAKKGKYGMARLNAMVKQRLVARKKWETPSMREDYEIYCDIVSPLEGMINSVQKKERAECGHSYSDVDEDDLPGDDPLMLPSKVLPLTPPSRSSTFAHRTSNMKSTPEWAEVVMCDDSYSDDKYELAEADHLTRPRIRPPPLWPLSLKFATRNKRSKESLRRAECPDELAVAMYQSANITTKAFTKK